MDEVDETFSVGERPSIRYDMDQALTGTELWAQLKRFSATSLRTELMELRKQVTEDMAAEMGRVVDRIVEVQPSAYRRSVGSAGGLDSMPIMSILSQRDERSVIAAAPRAEGAASHEWTCRPVRGYAVQHEIEKAEKDFEDQGEIAGTTRSIRSSRQSRRSTQGKPGGGLKDVWRQTQTPEPYDPMERPTGFRRGGSSGSVTHDARGEELEVIEPPRWSYHQPEIPGAVGDNHEMHKVESLKSSDARWRSEADSDTRRSEPPEVARFSSHAAGLNRAGSREIPAGFIDRHMTPSMSMRSMPAYRVAFQSIVRRPEFDVATGIFIILNAFSIGYQTDYIARNNLQLAPPAFRVVEGVFCVAFTVELSMRLSAHGIRYFKMIGWRWNVFDVVVVALQLFETFTSIILSNMQDAQDASELTFDFSIMRMLRIVRLVRIIRVIRVLRFIAELRTLVYSVLSTFRQFCWTVILMFLLIFITGVQFTQMVSDYKVSIDKDDPGNKPKIESLDRYYGSLSRSILSLFASITGGIDWQDMVDPLIDHISPVLAALFCAYVAFGIFALLNVVTGIFVQSAMQAAKQDTETYVVNHVRELFDSADVDASGIVSWAEFEDQLNTRPMKEYFKHLDIDISEAKGLFTLLDLNGDGEISADEFLNGSLRLRGQARALEVEVMMREIAQLCAFQRKQEAILPGLCDKIDKLNTVVTATAAKRPRSAHHLQSKPHLDKIGSPLTNGAVANGDFGDAILPEIARAHSIPG